MNVLVNGAGNIGTTLASVLLKFRDVLSLEAVYVNKNRPRPWTKPDLDLLSHHGAEICSPDPASGYPPFSEVIAGIDYVFDCTADGIATSNLEFYRSLENLTDIAASAQGSEKSFGTPFMTGVNPAEIASRKFVNIVSCNTHASVSILKTLAGDDLSNLENADFVIVRRSDDIGSHERLVGANVVARHRDPLHGTHPGVDIVDLLNRIGIRAPIRVSGITTPSQLMHAVRFNIGLKNPVAESEIYNSIRNNPLVSITDKFDSNVVFDLGRRYGFHGRIYSHCIFVMNNLLIDRSEIAGWAFIPQEGNTILSTIDSFLLQTGNSNRDPAFERIRSELISPEW
jgi:glyceraldehyde-3-phosphate dehydrogenase (NAD(P))